MMTGMMLSKMSRGATELQKLELESVEEESWRCRKTHDRSFFKSSPLPSFCAFCGCVSENRPCPAFPPVRKEASVP